MQDVDRGADLSAIASEPTAPTRRPPDAVWAESRDTGEHLAITLWLDDLLPDANGEIVVVSTGRGCRLSIVTDQRICGSGLADGHVTAEGYDVRGLAYCVFEGGRRLYYPPDLTLSIAQPKSW